MISTVILWQKITSPSSRIYSNSSEPDTVLPKGEILEIAGGSSARGKTCPDGTLLGTMNKDAVEGPAEKLKLGQ